jgi:ribonuclease HII
LIDEQLDGQMIFRVCEGRQRSSYRVGSSEIHFQTKAEEHFPVAVASMVCKYLRELSMELFNDFWRQHLPDVKPTKGYPVDAKRFRKDIADVQKKLEILDATLWRER